MKWILSLLLLISVSALGQTDEESKYIRYQNQYGMRMPRLWADSILKAMGLVKFPGITSISDTSTYKPIAINSSGDVKKFPHWPGTGTTLTNASAPGDTLLTGSNTVKRLIEGWGMDWVVTANGLQAIIDSSEVASLFDVDSVRDELSSRLDILENTQWYVDGNAGNDLNDGKSAERSVRTIAKLLTLPIEKHDVVNVARGSYFREFLNLSTLDSITVRDYGLGKKPVFDAADVAANGLFSLRSSTTNVYKITWTNAFRDNTDQSFYGVWEDGRRLIRQTSIANVDATPGSYYYSAITQSGGTDTIYVHASNSSNIATNGRLYEVTRRPMGVQVNDGCKIYNIHTRRNGSNDGSVKTGHNAYLQGLIAEDGTKHNLFMASGTAENCVAWKCDSAFAGGTTMFVSFTTSTGADTMDVLYKNCITIAGKNNDPYISTTVIGVYAHVGAPAPTYRSVTVDGGSYIQCASGVDGEPVTLNVKNANFLKCATAISKSSPIGAAVVEGNTFTACTVCVSANQPDVYFHYNKINSIGVDKIIQANASDSVSCTYNTVQGGNINAFVQDELATNPALTFKHNIFSNPSGSQAILLAPTNVVSTSARLHLDSNLYNNGAYVLADGIKTIANMQAVGKEIASSNGFLATRFYGDLLTNDFFIPQTDAAYGFAGSTSTFDSVYRFPYNIFNLPQTIFESPSSVTSKSDLSEDNNIEPSHAVNAQNLYVYKDAYTYNEIDDSDSSKRIANTEYVKRLVGTGGYTLPNASGSTLGGIKIGTGLSINGSGVASVSSTLDDITDNGATTTNNISTGAITASGVIKALSTINLASPAGVNRWDWVLVDAGSGLYDLVLFNENNSTGPVYIDNGSNAYYSGTSVNLKPTTLHFKAAPAASADSTFAVGTYNTTHETNQVLKVPLQRTLKGSTTWDPTNISANSSTSTTLTVTGAALGDPVTISKTSGSYSNGEVYFAYVSATNTVTIQLQNVSGGSFDIASATYNVIVLKY